MKLFKNRHFTYMSSKKLVLLSVLLVSASVLLTFVLITDLFFLLIYFGTTCTITLIMLIFKLFLYSKRTEASEEPYSNERSTRMWPLILMMIFGISLPFLLLFILDPLSWFIFLNGYIAGVNLPEIILYLYARIAR